MQRRALEQRSTLAGQLTCVTPFLAALVLALLAAVSPGAQQSASPAQAARPLTVERIYGAPNLSGRLTEGVEWSPDGKLLSYFHRTGAGVEAGTDIWVLDVATGERRVLVDSEKLQKLLPPAAPSPPGKAQQTGLGRLEPQKYSWAPGGDALLFVSQGDLYWLDLKTQAVKRLTQPAAADGGTPESRAVQDPKISPDGRWVSFVRGYDLWVVNVATAEQKQLTHDGREEWMNGQLDWVYPEELDIHTAYWWSPDSSQIAYLQMDERPVTKYPLVNYLSYTGETQTMRYPKAGGANPIVRVGVVPVAGGSTRWMDTGGDRNVYLARVDWLRDSKRLAIQRLNRSQNKLELLFANAADGRAQTVLTEQDRYWINVRDDLYFFADGRRFLWSSERDAYRHLYLYDLRSRRTARCRLFPGDREESHRAAPLSRWARRRRDGAADTSERHPQRHPGSGRGSLPRHLLECHDAAAPGYLSRRCRRSFVPAVDAR